MPRLNARIPASIKGLNGAFILLCSLFLLLSCSQEKKLSTRQENFSTDQHFPLPAAPGRTTDVAQQNTKTAETAFAGSATQLKKTPSKMKSALKSIKHDLSRATVQQRTKEEIKKLATAYTFPKEQKSWKKKALLGLSLLSLIAAALVVLILVSLAVFFIFQVSGSDLAYTIGGLVLLLVIVVIIASQTT